MIHSAGHGRARDEWIRALAASRRQVLSMVLVPSIDETFCVIRRPPSPTFSYFVQVTDVKGEGGAPSSGIHPHHLQCQSVTHVIINTLADAVLVHLLSRVASSRLINNFLESASFLSARRTQQQVHLQPVNGDGDPCQELVDRSLGTFLLALDRLPSSGRNSNLLKRVTTSKLTARLTDGVAVVETRAATTRS